MKSNLYIGLSGGIASGKTIVSDEFSSLGADIIDTDIIARELIFPGSETLNEIVSVFGENVLQDDGNLNRKLMRQIIFSEKDKKITLEEIMHPKIHNKVKLKIQSASAGKTSAMAGEMGPSMLVLAGSSQTLSKPCSNFLASTPCLIRASSSP